MSKPKLVVLRLRELLFTGALVIFGVAILLLIIGLVSVKEEKTPSLLIPSADHDSRETSGPL